MMAFRGAAHVRSITKIALKLQFLCVPNRPIRYGFRACAGIVSADSANSALDWVVSSAFHAGHKYDFW